MLEPCPAPRNVTAFIVVRQRRQIRPKLDGSTEGGPIEWAQVGDPHPTALGAMRAYVVGNEPELAQVSDDLIRRHWPSFRRNHGVKLQLQH